MASPADRIWPAWWHSMDACAYRMLGQSDALAGPLTLHARLSTPCACSVFWAVLAAPVRIIYITVW